MKQTLLPLMGGLILAACGCAGFHRGQSPAHGRLPGSATPARPYAAPIPDPGLQDPDSQFAPTIPNPNSESRFRNRATPHSAMREPQSRWIASRENKTQRWDSLWTPAYESTERRPIEVLRLGQGPFRTLIVGNLHGHEPDDVAVMDRLARHLKSNPQLLAQQSVLLVRTPNPDGLARSTRTNSRGVDLNRNFPTRHFQAMPAYQTGTHPGSEVETLALLKILYDLRPHRVVHVASGHVDGGVLQHNAKARPATVQLASLQPARIRLIEHISMPGTLETYASELLDLETITVTLPDGAAVADLWNTFGPLLVCAIHPADGPLENQSSTASDITGNSVPFTGELETPDRPAYPDQRQMGTSQNRTGRNVPLDGYVELSPPPKVGRSR